MSDKPDFKKRLADRVAQAAAQRSARRSANVPATPQDKADDWVSAMTHMAPANTAWFSAKADYDAAVLGLEVCIAAYAEALIGNDQELIATEWAAVQTANGNVQTAQGPYDEAFEEREFRVTELTYARQVVDDATDAAITPP